MASKQSNIIAFLVAHGITGEATPDGQVRFSTRMLVTTTGEVTHEWHSVSSLGEARGILGY